MKVKIIDRKNYTISIDKTKNRIYFQLHKQAWKADDVSFLLVDWKEVIPQLENNFTILSDIRNLQMQSPKLDKSHEEAQRYVAENGLLKLARVLPNNDIVNFQFARIAKRSFIPNTVFYTVEDAEKYLDKVVKDFEKSQENEAEN